MALEISSVGHNKQLKKNRTKNIKNPCMSTVNYEKLLLVLHVGNTVTL